MSGKIFFGGIEVDDKSFHVSLVSSECSERFEFACKPNKGALTRKLQKYSDLGHSLKLCYEATYVGFSLVRELRASGFECEVIAPSLVPEMAAARIKTDKLDCRKLAEYLRVGLLTPVHVPAFDEETVRDLVRTRHFLSRQVRSLKAHILSLCRRVGLDYRSHTGLKACVFFTERHIFWLRSEFGRINDPALSFNGESLIFQLQQMNRQLSAHEAEIERIAQGPKYLKKVQALRCYRGVDTLSAMTLTTEIGDASRFPHPRQLTSYAGMDIAEYSSGASQRRFSITRMGNRHLRTTVVEACQQVWKVPRVGKDLRRRREQATEEHVEIADRCMKRLYKKSSRMLHNGKIRNKVKVACAREMLGFVWETLRAAA